MDLNLREECYGKCKVVHMLNQAPRSEHVLGRWMYNPTQN